MDIYVTGSNSKMLSKDVLTEFRGRGDEVRVYPLSFREFCSAREDSKENALKDYMLYGGMPFILSRPSPESKISYLQNLFEETYIKDIVERNSIRNQGLLNSLTDEICSATGSLTSPTKLANTINSRYHSGKDEKVNNNTVASYLAHLENAFMRGHIARRYHEERCRGTLQFAHIQYLDVYTFLLAQCLGSQFGQNFRFSHLLLLQ